MDRRYYGEIPLISSSGSSYDDFCNNIYWKDASGFEYETFNYDTDYYLGIALIPDDGYSIENLEASDVSLQLGTTTLKPSILYKEEQDGVVYAAAIFKLPTIEEEVVTYEIPIKKTVTLGGKYAPRKTTFNF